MKTAVYSGSFNPLHTGHLSILQKLEESGFDSVLLVVSPHNPLKSANALESAQQRLQSAREALQRHPELQKTQVCDIEFTLPSPNYSYNTLCALRERHPGTQFSIVIGADNLDAFRKWAFYSRILLEFGVCVFPREGWNMQELKADLLKENPSYKIELMEMPLVKISSTFIREAIAAGQDVSSLLM